MSNALDHRFFAAAGVFGAAAVGWSPDDHWSKHPVIAACIAGGCGTLPDLIEPATSPLHRQLFHSVAFATVVGVMLYRTYQWQPDTDSGRVTRHILLFAGAAYLIHLAMDSMTPRSLPLIGR